MGLNAAVRQYWEKEPCGTSEWIVKEAEERSPEWFKGVEAYRYEQEPHIPAVADYFSRRVASSEFNSTSESR